MEQPPLLADLRDFVALHGPTANCAQSPVLQRRTATALKSPARAVSSSSAGCFQMTPRLT
jgi:hypothetical protein